jgi:hypothetical protein
MLRAAADGAEVWAMEWDWKFWATLFVNVIGLGIMWLQLRIMKKQIAELPSPRSAKRLSVERQLSKRLYIPVFVMAGLVLLSWLPYVLTSTHSATYQPIVIGWGGSVDGCAAQVQTSTIMKQASGYRLFLICHIADPTIDQMEDEKIAISKPFNITGRVVLMEIRYPPSAPIREVAKEGSVTEHKLVLLPKDEDGSRIRKLSDVAKVGGQVL